MTIEEIKIMSREERYGLNSRRRFALLNFLGDGEFWITAENVRLLLGVEHLSYVRRFLDRLVVEEILIKRVILVTNRSKNYYCITARGMAFLGNFLPFKPSKLSFQGLYHHERVQALRIALINSDRNSWEWRSELDLKRDKDLGFASIPDALLMIDDRTIAIELQRNLYSRDAFIKKIAKLLNDVYSKRINQILYVCCDNLKAKNLNAMFNSIDYVKNTRGEAVQLIEEHRNYFKFIDYDNFMEYVANV